VEAIANFRGGSVAPRAIVACTPPQQEIDAKVADILNRAKLVQAAADAAVNLDGSDQSARMFQEVRACTRRPSKHNEGAVRYPRVEEALANEQAQRRVRFARGRGGHLRGAGCLRTSNPAYGARRSSRAGEDPERAAGLLAMGDRVLANCG
jgi:hypothetical protein